MNLSLGKSAFSLFCEEERNAVQAKLGDTASATEVTAELTKLWAALVSSSNEADTAKLHMFAEQAEEDRRHCEAEMALHSQGSSQIVIDSFDCCRRQMPSLLTTVPESVEHLWSEDLGSSVEWDRNEPLRVADSLLAFEIAHVKARSGRQTSTTMTLASELSVGGSTYLLEYCIVPYTDYHGAAEDLLFYLDVYGTRELELAPYTEGVQSLYHRHHLDIYDPDWMEDEYHPNILQWAECALAEPVDEWMAEDLLDEMERHSGALPTALLQAMTLTQLGDVVSVLESEWSHEESAAWCMIEGQVVALSQYKTDRELDAEQQAEAVLAAFDQLPEGDIPEAMLRGLSGWQLADIVDYIQDDIVDMSDAITEAYFLDVWCTSCDRQVGIAETFFVCDECEVVLCEDCKPEEARRSAELQRALDLVEVLPEEESYGDTNASVMSNLLQDQATLKVMQGFLSSVKSFQESAQLKHPSEPVEQGLECKLAFVQAEIDATANAEERSQIRAEKLTRVDQSRAKGELTRAPIILDDDGMMQLTRAKGERVTRAKGERVTRAKGERVTRAKGERVTRAKGERVTRAKGERVTRAKGERVTRAKGERVTRARAEKKHYGAERKQEEQVLWKPHLPSALLATPPEPLSPISEPPADAPVYEADLGGDDVLYEVEV